MTDEKSIEAKYQELKKEILLKSIDLESAVELIFSLWNENKIISTIHMLKKVIEIKDELVILAELQEPEEFIKMKKAAYGRLGYEYQRDE